MTLPADDNRQAGSGAFGLTDEDGFMKVGCGTWNEIGKRFAEKDAEIERLRRALEEISKVMLGIDAKERSDLRKNIAREALRKERP